MASGPARWEAPVLAMVASVGLALRFVRLDAGWFGVDQARDVAIALDVVNGTSWPVVGPTMRRVTRLGALYHYFWALPYVVCRDPLAGYWFAALLSSVAAVLAWWVARRCFGPAAAVCAAAVAAAHPVWVIDGRICWAPAALPCVALIATVVLLGARSSAVAPPPAADRPRVAPLGTGRAALLGALLGLAIQLHITMIVWAAAAALLVLLDRPPRRTLAAGLAAAAVVGAPALWAMLGPSPATESGLAALPARAPLAPPLPRLVNALLLPAHVFQAFGRWDPGTPIPSATVTAAVIVLAVALGLGTLRLAIGALRGDRRARVVLVPSLCVIAAVVGLPGDAWYYYLDATLPLWALAAAAAVAPTMRSPSGVAAGTSAARAAGAGARAIGIVAIVGAAGVLGAATAAWIAGAAAAGWIPVEPAALTLDGRPGRDVAHAGRVATVAVERAVAALATTVGDGTPGADAGERGDGAAVEERVDRVWRRLHGPAFGDAFGDNAFWVRWSLAHPSAAAMELQRLAPFEGALGDADAPRHLAFWWADDAIATGVVAVGPPPRDALPIRIGPLLAVRYRPRLDYASCRTDSGASAAIPLRVVPEPTRYGDGTPELAGTLPAAVTCALRPCDPSDDDCRTPAAAERLVVGAFGGAGTVMLASDGRGTPAAAIAALCVPLGASSASVRMTIDGGRGEIDLYDVPLGVGCGRPPTAPHGDTGS